MSTYATWKQKILGVKPLDIDGSGDFDCVDVIKSRALDLWPNLPWQTTVGYGNAKDLFNGAPTKYWQKIRNTEGPSPTIDIRQGDFCVYGATPSGGFANQYNNPYGHVGVVDSTYSGGVVLMQQESGTGKAPYLARRNFTYAPLIGVLRPITEQEETVQEQDVRNVLTAFYGTTAPDDQVKAWAGKSAKDFAYWLVSGAQPKAYLQDLRLWKSTGIKSGITLDKIKKELGA